MAQPKTTTEPMRIGGTEIRINPKQVVVEGTEVLDLDVMTDRKITVDAAYAEKYIDLPEFKGERKVAENHVQFLHDEMAAGNFNPTIVTIAMAVLNGVKFKINGQHTNWAVWSLCQSNPDFKLSNVREITYRCDTEEQLRKLYSTFDRLLARSDKHVTQIHLVDTPEFGDLPPSVLKMLIPGLTMWLFENRSERARYSPEQVATLARREYADTFRRVAKFWSAKCSNPDGSHLRRQAVYAALFATFDKDKKNQYVEDFWGSVVDGINLATRSDPRYMLREFLKNTTLQANENKKRIVDPEDMYRICVQAWNKWRAGEQQKMAFRATNERVKPK